MRDAFLERKGVILLLKIKPRTFFIDLVYSNLKSIFNMFEYDNDVISNSGQ